MRRALVVFAVLTGLIVGLAALLFAPILEHTRRVSPDGHFVIVVRTQPVYLFIAMMPGSGSDKPAGATLYHDGRSCGSVVLPMASFVYEQTWDIEGRPRRAEIKFAGSWNLDTCRVEKR
jgi:hypothetical protein